MSFPRYPKYKDSGVEWLGEVPEHWEVERLKWGAHVFPSNVDKKSVAGETPVHLCNYTDVYYNSTITRNLDFMAATATEEQIARFSLRAGDTVITKDSETSDDIAVGAYVPQSLPGVICGYHLAIIRPNETTGDAFLKYFFDSRFAKACVAVLANGLTRVGLGQYALDNLAVPFPPPPEQSCISAFLDRETAKIDALVAEQERLIALLKEKRQAVISHAVTKGLNPGVPMKDSGIEWLGEVPAHWEVVRGAVLGELFGSELVPEDCVSPDGDLPFIKVGSMSADTLAIESWDWFVDSAAVDRCRPRKDYLVFPKRGAAIFMNKVNFVTRPSVIDPNLMGWQVGNRAEPMFVAYVLKVRKLEGLADVSTVPQINNKHILPERFPLPQIEEQRSIVAHLNSTIGGFDSLVIDVERTVALLHERRSALISAAVTGQIDVRHLATDEAAA